MKSAGGLFERIASPENLAAALRRAARGKLHRGPVSRFAADADRELAALREELLSGAYRPRPFAQFGILDPKPRLISCADFRDRVVHHAVCAHVAPVIERRLIADNFACREGKGSHRAVLRAQVFARRFGYWLRTDVRHYYDTIEHGVLLELLERLFREPRLRDLLEVIVRNGAAGHAPGKGLPIGSLTSQWFANLYLDGVDHWIAEARRPGAYVRYMDDLAVWSDSKAGLQALADDLEEKMACELGLEMKREATQVAPSTEGMPFLGYRVFPGLVREKGARVRRRRTLLAAREAECAAGLIGERQLQDCARAMDGPRRFLGFGAPLAKSDQWEVESGKSKVKNRKSEMDCLEAPSFRPSRSTTFYSSTFHFLLSHQGRRSRGSNRVNRGGSWNNDDASNFRGANRNRNDPANRNDNQGFRLVSTHADKDGMLSNPPNPASRACGTETARPGAAGSSAKAGSTSRAGHLS
jgi:hypothetical protein